MADSRNLIVGLEGHCRALRGNQNRREGEYMKKFLIGMLVGMAVPIIVVFGYLRLGMAEVRADIPPGRWENYLMNTGMHASVKREAPNAPNPVLPTDENLIAGGKLYLGACAGCHGRPGKPFGGKGPILYPPISELPVVGTRSEEHTSE